MPATTMSCSVAPSRNCAHLALIVEYHPWLRLKLANLFEESGFDVQSASNGAAGLRLGALPGLGHTPQARPTSQLVHQCATTRLLPR